MNEESENAMIFLIHMVTKNFKSLKAHTIYISDVGLYELTTRIGKVSMNGAEEEDMTSH